MTTISATATFDSIRKLCNGTRVHKADLATAMNAVKNVPTEELTKDFLEVEGAATVLKIAIHMLGEQNSKARETKSACLDTMFIRLYQHVEQDMREQRRQIAPLLKAEKARRNVQPGGKPEAKHTEGLRLETKETAHDPYGNQSVLKNYYKRLNFIDKNKEIYYEKKLEDMSPWCKKKDMLILENGSTKRRGIRFFNGKTWIPAVSPFNWSNFSATGNAKTASSERVHKADLERTIKWIKDIKQEPLSLSRTNLAHALKNLDRIAHMLDKQKSKIKARKTSSLRAIADDLNVIVVKRKVYFETQKNLLLEQPKISEREYGPRVEQAKAQINASLKTRVNDATQDAEIFLKSDRRQFLDSTIAQLRALEKEIEAATRLLEGLKAVKADKLNQIETSGEIDWTEPSALIPPFYQCAYKHCVVF